MFEDEIMPGLTDESLAEWSDTDTPMIDVWGVKPDAIYYPTPTLPIDSPPF